MTQIDTLSQESFKENHIKPNGDKCHLLVTTEKLVGINIDGGKNYSKEQNLLGIKFDSSLSFEGHIKTTCISKNSQLYGPS